ncbi:MAG: hypothetical protein ACUVTL_02155 [Thermoproteota archaeon]
MDLRKYCPEYDVIFEYLIRKNGDRVLIAIIGYNFEADDVIRNRRIGKFVGYWIEEVKRAG